MDEYEKQILWALRKQLEEVGAEIEKAQADLINNARRRGEILRELRRKEHEITSQIEDITRKYENLTTWGRKL
jgi:chromosome segregation ATPase